MFCFKLWKTATEKHKILESVYAMKVYFVCLCLNGLRDWRGTWPWRLSKDLSTVNSSKFGDRCRSLKWWSNIVEWP